MPGKTKKVAAATAALPRIPKELIDQFVSGPMSGEAVNAATLAFKKALIERAMGSELAITWGIRPASPSLSGPPISATASAPRPC